MKRMITAAILIVALAASPASAGNTQRAQERASAFAAGELGITIDPSSVPVYTSCKNHESNVSTAHQVNQLTGGSWLAAGAYLYYFCGRNVVKETGYAIFGKSITDQYLRDAISVYNQY